MEPPTYLGLQARGLLALPLGMRKRLHLDEPGAQVEVVERPDGVVELRPHLAVPTDQSWVWSDKWQATLKRSLEELAAGRVTTHSSNKKFLDSLK